MTTFRDTFTGRSYTLHGTPALAMEQAIINDRPKGMRQRFEFDIEADFNAYLEEVGGTPSHPHRVLVRRRPKKTPQPFPHGDEGGP
jgi:hypothetical protein